MDIFLFILSFALILIGCELFTNGIEWLGRRLDLAEGAIGSVLAAIGTALPETLVPLIAILLVGGDRGQEIGAGAILGSPFMLATLALFFCGLAILVFRKKRGRTTLAINKQLIRRDLKFFLIAYGLAALVAFSPTEWSWLKWVVGFSLFPIYIYYTIITLRGSESSGEHELEDLFLRKGWRRLNGIKEESEMHESECSGDSSIVEGSNQEKHAGHPALPLIIAQIFLGLMGIILGATVFVGEINSLAELVGLSPILLAMIVAPIATELPEMFNSVIWIKNKKDTYAIGNITGAMVFQSCIPVTIGILLTEWHLNLSTTTGQLQGVSIGIALLSGSILYLRSNSTEIKIAALMLGGAFYILFMTLVLGWG